MLERFSEDARLAVSRAADEAHNLGHGHIGTEHLLLGLIGETGTAVSEALIAAGAYLLPAREKVVEALSNRSPGPSAGAGREPAYTDRAARALDRSSRLSLRMGSEQVRCEHILFSLLDVEGTAGQVLRGLGVDPESVRQDVMSRMSAPAEREAVPDESADTGRARRGPNCVSCGSALETSIARTTLTIGSGASTDHVDVYYCAACGAAIGAEGR